MACVSELIPIGYSLRWEVSVLLCKSRVCYEIESSSNDYIANILKWSCLSRYFFVNFVLVRSLWMSQNFSASVKIDVCWDFFCDIHKALTKESLKKKLKNKRRTMKLQQKCCSLNFATTDCSILKSSAFF